MAATDVAYRQYAVDGQAYVREAGRSVPTQAHLRKKPMQRDALHSVTLQLGTGPVVLESPHSGTAYPPDFGYACDLEDLRRAEDTHVDALWSFSAGMGHTLLCAQFPRAYIDVNRGLGDIDARALADAGGIEGADPGRHAQLGMGLFWTRTLGGAAVYARKLAVAELDRRIDRCWVPYHALLAHTIGQAHARHGWSLHISCHSMPSDPALYARECPGWKPTDFVISDGEGRWADPAIAARAARILREHGWSVEINYPFRGAELLRQHGDPLRNRHSIQVEIRRDLYMDESRSTLHEGSAGVVRSLRALLEALPAGMGRQHPAGEGARLAGAMALRAAAAPMPPAAAARTQAVRPTR